MRLPPMMTLRAGLRAYCMNSRGAERCTSVRHMPRGKRTRSPCTSAPAAFQICNDSGSSRKSMPISSRMVSALCSSSSSPSAVEHLVVRHLARDVGDEGVAARGAGGDLGVTAARATGAGARARLVRVHFVFPDRNLRSVWAGPAAIMGHPRRREVTELRHGLLRQRHACAAPPRIAGRCAQGAPADRSFRVQRPPAGR